MATAIKSIEPFEPHRCLDEIIRPDRKLIAGSDGVDYTHEQPIGQIIRCSCGILWRTKKYLPSFSKWVQAGWWLRYKHRNDGWDNIQRSDY